ncbi:MAG: aminotransferase class V-fold PLP-dependent enzyme [Candidatus Aegiribacteria sp.]|nr:aminotransferase class V-fold PLP-dependent enzyme [Candidatus Aegiribacteria sp.]
MKVYLDNNATTRIAQEVLDAMLPYLTERFGNPSSFHSFGSDLMEDIEAAREKVAVLLGAHAEEIVFTSGGTESDNMALISATAINPLKPGLVASTVEHPAVLETAEYIKSKGYPVGLSEVNGDGTLNMNSLERLISEQTGLVSIMMANNETGVIMPVEKVARIAHEAGALFHTDAVQAASKIPVDVRSSGIDLLSISAHKFHGPKGVGALFIRKGIDIPPFMLGGYQENGMRAGTYNTAGIVGLGVAAELATAHLSEENCGTELLLEKLENGILEKCPGAFIVGADVERLPNTATVLFRGVESEAVMTLLDLEGICVSSGSACSTVEESSSYVLAAMGIDPVDANTALRFSLSRYTTGREIDYVLEVLPPIVEKLRDISPYANR